MTPKKHELSDGEAGIIYNEHGEISVKIKFTEKVPPGVVWAPRELVDETGNTQNGLSPGTPQLIGGGPVFNTVRIRFKT